MTTYYHEFYKELTQRPGHPESPHRMEAIVEMLEERLPNEKIVEPEPASDDVLALVHSEDYIELIKNFGEGHYDADTYMRENTFELAAMAAGGAVASAEHTFKTKKPSYAIVRPPGHHSGSDYGGGFCYFNNAAIAAKKLLQQTPKVAIIDMDVHHGNGTHDIFKEDKDVLYISTHQWGIYPGTGVPQDVGIDDGEGFTVNVALSGHSGDATFDLAYEKIIMPILKQYKPGAIIVSFGGDGHYMEQLASLKQSTPGYLRLIKQLMNTAKEVSENRISFVLEGGYHTAALAEMICGTIAMFNNKPFETTYNDNLDENTNGQEWVEASEEIQKEYWTL